jgi:endonuclease YncB( thermonuclease family)
MSIEPEPKFAIRPWRPNWKRAHGASRPRYFRRRARPGVSVLLLAAAVGAAGYYGFSSGLAVPYPQTRMEQVRFVQCGYFARSNCVVDGDTFVFAGEKIRIADIDAPETGGAQCAGEVELGERAKRRLRELLNEGPFELRSYQSRDTDRYGRKLRLVVRDGRSLGDRLIAEGLARRWSGRRMPWCA